MQSNHTTTKNQSEKKTDPFIERVSFTPSIFNDFGVYYIFGLKKVSFRMLAISILETAAVVMIVAAFIVSFKK